MNLSTSGDLPEALDIDRRQRLVGSGPSFNAWPNCAFHSRQNHVSPREIENRDGSVLFFSFQFQVRRASDFCSQGGDPRKDTTRTPTRFKCAEGNMDRSDSASFCSVRRGRRPHGTHRNFMRDSKNDFFFLPPNAEAFKRDNPNAEGHFALATQAREMATAIRDFLGRKLTQTSAA